MVREGGTRNRGQKQKGQDSKMGAQEEQEGRWVCFGECSRRNAAYLGPLNRWHHVFGFPFVQHLPVLLRHKSKEIIK